MCGIITSFGFIDTAQRFRKVRHRGTVDQQLTAVDGISIGHVLLAIQNTTGLSLYEDDEFVFAYNGEVYDDWEGQGFDSDTMWLFTQLKTNGVEATIKRLNAMFGFVFYNKITKELYIARDYLGIIPLYYYSYSDGSLAGQRTLFKTMNSGRRFLFASEIKCFYDLPLKDVNLFPHGHYALIKNGEIEFKCYHSIRHNLLEDAPDGVFLSAVREKLSEAVKCRLKATSAKVCALLSGGVDSTIITALAKRHKPDLVAFTFSVGDKGKADLHYARVAAKHIGVPLIEVIVTPEDVLKHLDEIIYMNEDSSWTQISSAVGQYFLAREIAKHGYRVAVGGEVADEIFATYPQIQRFSWRDEQYIEARARLIDKVGSNNLSRSNKVMLGAGTVEVRNPMEDRDFLEFAGNVPARFKDGMVGTRKMNKPLLRLAFADLIPDEIMSRPKGCQGRVTYTDELLEPLKDVIKDRYNEMFNKGGVIQSVNLCK